MQLVIASNNPKKRAEIKAIMDMLGVTVVPVEATRFVDVMEDGDSFAANARKKAESFCRANRQPALGDDSGLCVDALDGAPGIFSSRFAGEAASDAENNARLLEVLAGRNDRGAHFVCALHLAFPDDEPPIDCEGQVDGVILDHGEGDKGFGYDPLFFCPELGKTFAVATPAEKARVSHRGRALRLLAEQLKRRLDSQDQL
ncbi:MAG: RdgB/HAM1 family non-canonical purine NTP pyrophosphatase [Mariprofundaceae bacterium]|nr:RdgB/HAM1 family non-canonical purine NTP pyrophosphatase [Mariprofundaceae bacterium]